MRLSLLFCLCLSLFFFSANAATLKCEYPNYCLRYNKYPVPSDSSVASTKELCEKISISLFKDKALLVLNLMGQNQLEASVGVSCMKGNSGVDYCSDYQSGNVAESPPPSLHPAILNKGDWLRSSFWPLTNSTLEYATKSTTSQGVTVKTGTVQQDNPPPLNLLKFPPPCSNESLLCIALFADLTDTREVLCRFSNCAELILNATDNLANYSVPANFLPPTTTTLPPTTTTTIQIETSEPTTEQKTTTVRERPTTVSTTTNVTKPKPARHADSIICGLECGIYVFFFLDYLLLGISGTLVFFIERTRRETARKRREGREREEGMEWSDDEEDGVGDVPS